MPIINTVIAGGGTTPTGTKSITANGTYDVTDYASADVQVPTTAPTYYKEFAVDANGKAINVSSVMNFNGITDIGDYIFSYLYYNNTNITGSVDMSSLTTISGQEACYYMFSGCTGLNGSVDLSSLTTISGSCSYMFKGCTHLTGVDLSSLTSVLANCASMFEECTGLTGTLDLSSLTTTNSNGSLNSAFGSCTNLTGVDLSSLVALNVDGFFNKTFYGCTRITSVDLSSLTTLNGSSTTANMFKNCSGLTTINMSSLKTINGSYICSSMFYGCTSLTEVNFESLETVKGTYGTLSLFQGCTSLTRVSFYALTPSSFDSNVQFIGMLTGVTGCTVHFPMAVQATIGSWSSVTAGFGGTNTTVLFDIVTSLTGADSNTYTRKQKSSTNSATAWVNNNTLYYTSGTTDPVVGDTIYSDAACTTAVTTISAIA